MTWVRLDDRFPQHPKVTPLSDKAFRAHLVTMCHVAAFRLDGAFTASTVASLRVSPAATRELVAAGLWETDGDGTFTIHDWLDWNISRADAGRMEDARREAGRLGGSRSAASKRQASATASATANAQAFATQANQPPTRPDPTRPDPTLRLGGKPPSTSPTLSDDERKKLLERYADVGRPGEAGEQIDLALSHKSAKNYTKLNLYVGNWLRRWSKERGNDGAQPTAFRGGPRGPRPLPDSAQRRAEFANFGVDIG